jgi:integrase
VTALARSAAIPGDDVFVLHDRPLRDGVALEETSQFGDDVWRLQPAIHKSSGRNLILNFNRFPVRFRPVAKQLAYAMLSGPLPQGEKRCKVEGVRCASTELFRFLTWLDSQAEPRCQRLATLTGADLLAYQRHLVGLFPNAATQRETCRAKVRLFWRWRHNLSDWLPFDPVHIDGWGEPDARGQRRGENRTSRIPEEVLGPLFVWALRFIDVFGPDIIAADQQWRKTRFVGVYQRLPVRKFHSSTGTLHQAISDHLETYVTSGRPLPGWRGVPNRKVLAQQIGCSRRSLDEPAYQVLIDQAEAKVGVSESAAFDIPIRGSLDGRPWTGDIVTHPEQPTSLAVLARHLQAAAYAVIAYLSGMRDSEVKELRRGCLRTERDSEGRPYRWKVDGIAFKGEDDPRGVPATWIVGEPVARAIAVMETLQPPDTDILFTRLPHGYGTRHRVRGATAMLNSTTNENLNHFVAWVNAYCDQHGRGDAIPAVNGRTFRLMTSHFRRTLAWFIARRPGGSIAGALQYRHHGIQIFEGYAGTSDSGFRAEVESEQALARGEHYLAMADAHEHTELTGPAAVEAARRLEGFGHRARFQGIVVTDERRLKRIMGREDPAVYPGTYITCVHDHSKALCERARRGRSEGLPDHGECQPLACRNVALTSSNTQAWRSELDRIDQRLAARPPLPPLMQHRLESRRAEITTFLSRNTSTPETA